MKKFNIEHIGLIVTEPVKMADWYKNVLGFNIKLCSQSDDADSCVAFITDNDNNTMLELGKLPEITPLCDSQTHHLQLHIALESDDPEKDSAYLIENGAKFIERCSKKMPGDKLIVFHDPWGNCIQLVKRASKIN
jgi:catechol 2,3-dioxygenase-like lactoylglutathione lyase family enzyme